MGAGTMSQMILLAPPASEPLQVSVCREVLRSDPTLLEPRSQYMRLALDPDSFANPQGEECK